MSYTINKIYHLADLHIRNLKRHKEYREVFNKFLKQVKQDNIEDSIIYAKIERQEIIFLNVLN